MLDTETYQVYLNISKVIGLCPWNKTSSKTSKKLSKVHLLACCIIFVVTSISTMVIKVNSSGNEDTPYRFSLTVVDTMEVVFDFIFMALVFTKCFFSTHWEPALGVVLKEMELDNSPARKTWARFAKLVVNHTITLSIFIFETYTWFGVAGNDQSVLRDISLYTALAMRTYYQFVLVSLIWELSSILKYRYKEVQTKIQNVFSANPERAVSLKHLKLKIRDIKAEYMSLYRATVDVSSFFGTTVLVFIACTVAALLNSCSWGLHYGYAVVSENYLIGPLLTSVFVSPLYNLTLTTFLVMACDRVERSGEDLVTACYLLQEGMDKSDVGDELTFLVQQLQALTPKFSAAGLFYVNRRVLSTLMTFTTSYVIVILQFKN